MDVTEPCLGNVCVGYGMGEHPFKGLLGEVIGGGCALFVGDTLEACVGRLNVFGNDIVGVPVWMGMFGG